MRKLITRYLRWVFQEPERAAEITGSMRRLSAHSAMFDVDLVVALHRNAERALSDDRYGDALAHLNQVAALHIRARRLRRTGWAGLLARTSLLRGYALLGLDRLAHALSAADDAVTRFHALAGGHARFQANYLHAAVLRAKVLWQLDRREDAVRAAEQGLRTAQFLIAHGRRHNTLPFLTMLCEWMARLERPDEGVRYGQDAVRQLRANRAAPAELAIPLLNLGACLLANHPADSLPTTDEVISLLEPLLDSEPARHEHTLLIARNNRVRAMRALGLPEENVLGPYPLCPKCRVTNGGLIATRHRQVHVAAHGRESCVDERLVGIMPKLWAVCDTTSSCQNDGADPPSAYVVTTNGQLETAATVLTELGFTIERRGNQLRFQLDNHPP